MRRLKMFRLRRRPALVAGVFLLAFPTVASTFMEIQELHWVARAGALVVWAVVAALVVNSELLQGERFGLVADEVLGGEEATRREETRAAAGDRVLRALLSNPKLVLQKCEFRLYIYDAELNLLVPSYVPEEADEAERWEVGKGAVGTAYLEGERVTVRGKQVWDGTYGLTPAQGKRYRDLAAVAAVPIRGSKGGIIGILAASTHADDGSLDSLEGRNEHIQLAQTVGRILIDVLRVAKD